MIRLIRYEFIKQFCKRSILALFVVFSLTNLFKIYGEYKSYSYLTDGNGERSWHTLHWRLYEEYQGEITPEKIERLLSVYQPLVEATSDMTASTATDDPNTMTGNLYSDRNLLDKYFVQKETPDFKKIKELIDVMAGVLQDKPSIGQLTENITQIEKVNEGKTAPFFSLPNQKGEKVTRLDKFKDKYMLINFWASWCEECDSTNVELRKINNKYKKNK